MLRVYITYSIPDARAKTKKRQFQALVIKTKLGAIRLADCYTVDAKLNKKQIEKTKVLLANPQIQKAETSPLALSPKPFSFAIEIAFLPGVTDNVGHTAKETLSDGAKVKFKPGQNVYSSQVFFFYLNKNNRKRSADLSAVALAKAGASAKADISKIANSLYNPLIQRATITSYEEFKKQGLKSEIPKVKITSSNKVIKVGLNVNEEALVKLGKLGIPETVIASPDASVGAKQSKLKNRSPRSFQPLATTTRKGPLALSLEELKAISDYFNKLGRQPTDIELEALAQTWSEHCKHTIFADPMDEIKDGIFKHYIKRATTDIVRTKSRTKNNFTVSVFTDNAGGITFDKNHVIAYKVETHNTPSALDPFGGAITGIGGVNRDALGFGLGAKPIANFYGFCLADPNDKTRLYRNKNLDQPMLSARRIMDGVIAGINAGGNQAGIPTPLGFLYFNERFRGKPLVFAGTLGLVPKKVGDKKGWHKQAQAGDYVVMVGGKVGLDGIHGATFASEGLHKDSPATAVQIGDPITQKKFSDAIAKEARDLNLYNSITDCGAGGLSSAVGEMAQQAGGCLVELDTVPLKYPGLAPWQIWISESQERMVLSVPKNKWQKLEKLMKARGVEAWVIGKFNDNEKCIVKYNDKTVLNLDMDFLHNGRPARLLKTEKMKHKAGNTQQPKIQNLTSYILHLISSLNITSTEFISRQYDHEVQASSVLKPLQGAGLVNSDVSIIRPVLNSKKAVVMSYGLKPHLSEIDAYLMAANSIDSAIKAAVAAGANVDYLALLDNFCWCSPDDPKRLWQLKEAARACYDFAKTYGTPFISGKDSMHNDFKGYGADGKPLKISIPPTLLITTVGVMPNIEKAISLDAKIPGDLLYILGETEDTLAVEADKNLKLYRAYYKAAQNNLIASGISVSGGGLAIALAKSLMGGNVGTDIEIENSEALFVENSGRILVSIDPKKAANFERTMSGNVFVKIGKVTKNPLMIIKDKNQKQIVKLNINQALREYKSTFKDY